MIENWGEFSREDGAGSVVALFFGPVLSRPFSALIYRLIPRNFRKRTRIALARTHLSPSSRLHCSNSAFVWRNSASTCTAWSIERSRANSSSSRESSLTCRLMCFRPDSPVTELSGGFESEVGKALSSCNFFLQTHLQGRSIPK